MVSTVPDLKTNKSLKLVLVDKKMNGWMAQNKPKCLIFILIYRVRVENQTS